MSLNLYVYQSLCVWISMSLKVSVSQYLCLTIFKSLSAHTQNANIKSKEYTSALFLWISEYYCLFVYLYTFHSLCQYLSLCILLYLVSLYLSIVSFSLFLFNLYFSVCSYLCTVWVRCLSSTVSHSLSYTLILEQTDTPTIISTNI